MRPNVPRAIKTLQRKANSPVAQQASQRAALRHASKQIKSNDVKLRKAVELYHIAPAFFPIPQQATSSAKAIFSESAKSISTTANDRWEKKLDNTIYSAILNTDSVSRRTPNLIPRTLQEYARDQSVRSASAPAPVSDSESRQAQDDVQSFASNLTSTTFMTKGEREQEQIALANIRRDSAASSSSSSSQGGLSHLTDRDVAMYQRRHSEKPDGLGSSVLDSSRYSGAERPTHLDRLVPGGNEWYGHQNLDARSAQIRDAIFGTVSGELPGLDIVRERFEQMRRDSEQSSTQADNGQKPIVSQAKSDAELKTTQ